MGVAPGTLNICTHNQFQNVLTIIFIFAINVYHANLIRNKYQFSWFILTVNTPVEDKGSQEMEFSYLSLSLHLGVYRRETYTLISAESVRIADRVA